VARGRKRYTRQAPNGRFRFVRLLAWNVQATRRWRVRTTASQAYLEKTEKNVHPLPRLIPTCSGRRDLLRGAAAHETSSRHFRITLRRIAKGRSDLTPLFQRLHSFRGKQGARSNQKGASLSGRGAAAPAAASPSMDRAAAEGYVQRLGGHRAMKGIARPDEPMGRVGGPRDNRRCTSTALAPPPLAPLL